MGSRGLACALLLLPYPVSGHQRRCGCSAPCSFWSHLLSLCFLPPSLHSKFCFNASKPQENSQEWPFIGLTPESCPCHHSHWGGSAQGSCVPVGVQAPLRSLAALPHSAVDSQTRSPSGLGDPWGGDPVLCCTFMWRSCGQVRGDHVTQTHPGWSRERWWPALSLGLNRNLGLGIAHALRVYFWVKLRLPYEAAVRTPSSGKAKTRSDLRK